MYSLFITFSFVLVSMLFEVSALSVPVRLAKRDDFREMHDAMNNTPRPYLPRGQAWDNGLVKRDPTICTVHVIVQIVELWYPTEYTRHITEGETITATVTGVIVLPAEPTTQTEASSTETTAWESNTSTWASNTDETALTTPTTFFITEPQPSWTFVNSYTETYLAVTDYDLISTSYSKTTYTGYTTDSAECANCVVAATATGAFCSQTTDATTFYYTYVAGRAQNSGPPVVSMNSPTTMPTGEAVTTTVPYVETTIWETRSDLIPADIATPSSIPTPSGTATVEQQLLVPMIPDTRPPKERITGPADKKATPIKNAKPPRKTPSKPHTTPRIATPDGKTHATPTIHFTAPPILIPDLVHHTTLTIPQIQWQQQAPVTITLHDGSRTTVARPTHTPTVITLADHSVTTLSPLPLPLPPRTVTLPPAPGSTKPLLFVPPPPASTARVITTGGRTITIPALQPVRATTTTATTTNPQGRGTPTVVLTTHSTVITLPWTTLTLLQTESFTTTTLGGVKNHLTRSGAGAPVLSTFSTVVTLPWTTVTVVQTGTVSPGSPSESAATVSISSSSSTQPFRSVNVLATDSASAPSQTGPLVLPLPTGESTEGGEKKNSAAGLRGDTSAALLAGMAAVAVAAVVVM